MCKALSLNQPKAGRAEKFNEKSLGNVMLAIAGKSGFFLYYLIIPRFTALKNGSLRADFYFLSLNYYTIPLGGCAFFGGGVHFSEGGMHLLIIHNDSSRKIAGAHLLRLNSFPITRTVKDVIIPAQQPLLRWCQRTARQHQ